MTRLLDVLPLRVEPVTEAFARRAAAAYALWGRGVHPAALNFGDCFSYAVAKQYDCPLLYVGNDFARTDIASGLPDLRSLWDWSALQWAISPPCAANHPRQNPQSAEPPRAAATPAAPQPMTASGETPEQALTRAQAAAQAKRLNEAAGICTDVLAAVPDHPAALALQGIVSAMAGDPEKGVVLLRRRSACGRATPPGMHISSSLCRADLPDRGRPGEGQEAVRLDPNNAEHLVNLSLIFVDADDRDRAMVCLLRALGLKHDHADGHLAMAQNLLAQGDFDPGWMEYEWRNLTEAGKATMPAMTSAPWNGMRIPNGRLLLVGDQGYGDTIQFARYIPMAVDRCQEIDSGCSAEMGPLLATIPGVKQYCHRWNDVPGHAAHCRLSSLPYLFRTQMDTIPAEDPYLKADPARIAPWHGRLDAMLPAGLKRIGLAWTGRPTHPNDRRRSMPLSMLAPVAQAGPAAFVSLQKPFPARDAEAMRRFPRMTDLSSELDRFRRDRGADRKS